MTNASFEVPITGDNILENNEQFELSIALNSLPDRVIVNDSNQTIVTIKDNDGKSSIVCDD